MRHRILGLIGCAGLTLCSIGAAQAQAADPNSLPLFRLARPDGTPVDPTGGGGGGGGGNAATTSNGTDGQATSATNQQNVVYNMLFNGTTWDRMRGAGGALNVAVTNFPGTQPVSGTVSALNLGIFNTTPPTVANGAQTVLQATANGSLFVDASRGTPGGMFTGQYNAALSTLTSGQAAYAALDSSGRLMLSGSSQSLGVFLGAGTSSIGALGATNNAGGLTNVSRIVSAAASTNATSAKTSAGRVYKITGKNNAAADRWLKFYNKASAPVPGTDTPFFQLPLPPGAFSFDAQDLGYTFGTGIAYAVTVGPADADATAVTAADILNLNVWYQ